MRPQHFSPQRSDFDGCPDDPTDHALQFRNVSARYPSSGTTALHECTFTVKSGEHVALLGLNGSGKTTLLLAVAGLVVTTGEITVDGVVLGPSTLGEIRKRIGMLFSTPEDQLLFPRVIDDVAYGLCKGEFLRKRLSNVRARHCRCLMWRDLPTRLHMTSPTDSVFGSRLRASWLHIQHSCFSMKQPQLLILRGDGRWRDFYAKHHRHFYSRHTIWMRHNAVAAVSW